MRCFYTICLCLCCSAIFAQGATSITTIDSLLKVGTDLFRKGEYATSAEVLERAKASALQNVPVRESATYANILHYLGSDSLQLSKHQAARLLLEEALEIFRRVLGSNHPECAKTLNALALAYKELSELDKAESAIVESLQIKEKNAPQKALDYTFNQTSLVKILQAKGQYERADSVIEDLVTRRKQLAGEKSMHYANALNIRAANRSRQFRLEEAEKDFLTSLSIIEQIKGLNSREYLSVFLNIGQHYAMMGLFEKADSTQRASLVMAEKMLGKSSYEYALALGNLGFILMEQGRVDEAKPVLEEAYTLNEKIFGPEQDETLRQAINLAAYYYNKGNFEQSAKKMKEIVYFFEKKEIKNNNYYLNLTNYAVILLEQKQFEASEHYFQVAEKAQHQYINNLHFNMGLLYAEWGKLALAEQYFLKALDEVQRSKTGSSFSIYSVAPFFHLAALYRKKGADEKALQYAQAGETYLETGLLERFQHLSEAELRQAADFLLSRSNPLYAAAADWGNAEINAFCYDNLLFAKGFVLEKAMAEKRAFDKNIQKQPEAWLAWKAVSRQLLAEQGKNPTDWRLVDSLGQKTKALEKKWGKNTAPTELLRWKQVHNALRAGEAAIEFARYEKPDGGRFKAAYLAFILTMDMSAPQMVPVCAEQTLQEMFGKGAFPLANYYGTQGNTLLYEQLFKPLMPHLKNIKKVWCAPIGLLHQVNFSAISTNKGNTLGDLFHFTVVGSTRQVASPKIAMAKPSTALLLGGIAYDFAKDANNKGEQHNPRPAQWENLPYSLEEVKEAKRLLEIARIKTELVSDTTATEQLIKQYGAQGGGPGILHFSTHGFYISDTARIHLAENKLPGMPIGIQDPMLRAGIVMAGANKASMPVRSLSDDGILNAQEISRLDLHNNQLVIVSACKSGLGDLNTYEGVIGLQRAFRLAGSRYLILNLWEPNSNFTHDFTKAFYRNWLSKDRADIPEAFAATQKELRAFNPDPQYWAGFVLLCL